MHNFSATRRENAAKQPTRTRIAQPEALLKHPIELPATLPPLAAADTALANLLGRQTMTRFFQRDDFPRRFVATVDNLGGAHAPPKARPTPSTPDRSWPLATACATRRWCWWWSASAQRNALDLYLRIYPLLQQAYEDLGSPKRYFNDRLIAVMDQLLTTPDAAYPLKVQLTKVKGSVPSVHPWARCEFADPALEALAAGQKVLLRIGPENQHRLKARLSTLRQELLTRAPPTAQ